MNDNNNKYKKNYYLSGKLPTVNRFVLVKIIPSRHH